jgi:hypothetical protein
MSKIDFFNKIGLTNFNANDKYDLQYILSDCPYSEGMVNVELDKDIEIVVCDEVKIIKSRAYSILLDYY